MHFVHISNYSAAINALSRTIFTSESTKKKWRINNSMAHYCQVKHVNLKLRHTGDTTVSPLHGSQSPSTRKDGPVQGRMLWMGY